MYTFNKAVESNWFSVKYRTRLIKPVSLQQVKTRVKYDLCFKGHEMQEYSAGGAAETTWKKCHVLAALIRDKRQNSELAEVSVWHLNPVSVYQPLQVYNYKWELHISLDLSRGDVLLNSIHCWLCARNVHSSYTLRTWASSESLKTWPCWVNYFSVRWEKKGETCGLG